MTRVLVLAVSLMCLSIHASAGTHKCKNSSGELVFQQTPCKGTITKKANVEEKASTERVTTMGKNQTVRRLILPVSEKRRIELEVAAENAVKDLIEFRMINRYEIVTFNRAALIKKQPPGKMIENSEKINADWNFEMSFRVFGEETYRVRNEQNYTWRNGTLVVWKGDIFDSDGTNVGDFHIQLRGQEVRNFGFNIQNDTSDGYMLRPIEGAREFVLVDRKNI